MIGERAVGTLPLPGPVRTSVGRADIAVTAQGYLPETQSVVVRGRERRRIQVRLSPIPLAEPSAATTVHPGPPLPIAEEPPNSPARHTPDRLILSPPRVEGPSDGRRPTLTRTFAWASAGLSVVSLGAGVTLNLTALQKNKQFNDNCEFLDNQLGPQPKTSNVTPGQCSNYHEMWQSERRWSLAGYAIGATLALTSGVLFWISKPVASEPNSRARLGCSPVPGGLLCHGMF